MDCELACCCQFFDDKMKDMPKSVEYIKSRLCHGDFESCNRYRIYKEYGGENVPPYLDPVDSEAIGKVLACLRAKQAPGTQNS